jgi:hypothetical protein
MFRWNPDYHTPGFWGWVIAIAISLVMLLPVIADAIARWNGMPIP